MPSENQVSDGIFQTYLLRGFLFFTYFVRQKVDGVHTGLPVGKFDFIFAADDNRGRTVDLEGFGQLLHFLGARLTFGGFVGGKDFLPSKAVCSPSHFLRTSGSCSLIFG